MNTIVAYASFRQVDPSRTISLRNAFTRQIKKRFNKVRALIKKAIVDEDVFALREGTQRITVFQTPGRRRFNFPRSADKVGAFMKWLRRMIADEILQVTEIDQVGRSVDSAWTNLYIQDSYRRGVIRARYQLSGVAPSLDATGGIGAAMLSPFHVDRIGLLYTRVFSDLKAITDAMDAQISKVLAQGLADGLSPTMIARQLDQVITGMGESLAITDTLGRFMPARVRAELLARTEIIRAHAEAQLQEFENWGVEGVKIKAEFVTAGDHRVCNLCNSYNRSVMTIDEARGVIPVHPRCRCIWLPYIPGLKV